MTWRDRLRPEIKLIAPDGVEFSALWSGNDRSLAKKVGVFEFPGVDGALLQDHGATATIYPLTFIFEGVDNDTEASKFLTACKQKGSWKVDHPTKGRLELQLLSVTEKIMPVASGNLTRFESEWMEPLKRKEGSSLSEQAHNVHAGTETLNDTAATQFIGNVSQKTARERSALETGVNKIIGIVSKTLGRLYRPVAAINSKIASIRRSITDGLTELVVDAAGLAGQIQNLIQLPAMASNDMSSRISAYSELLTELYDFSPKDDDPSIAIDTAREIKNRAAIQEIAMVAAVGALGIVAVSSVIETRPKSMLMIENVNDLFTATVNELDKSQSLLLTKNIDNQFFSQSESFPSAVQVIASSLAYLLHASVGLATERRFTLIQPRAPIEIVITEYEGLGHNDENFDAFIAANELSGKEILLLNAGRKVVLYV